MIIRDLKLLHLGNILISLENHLFILLFMFKFHSFLAPCIYK